MKTRPEVYKIYLSRVHFHSRININTYKQTALNKKNLIIDYYSLYLKLFTIFITVFCKSNVYVINYVKYHAHVLIYNNKIKTSTIEKQGCHTLKMLIKLRVVFEVVRVLIKN